MVMDGRFDQQFAELFAESLSDQNGKAGLPALWPWALAGICGLVVIVAAQWVLLHT
jgi:hypothetical protein